uniref:RNA-dependent RNA polymerase ORF1 n=1 Tax=Cereal yellow dwarf virus RPS TaxID=228582 RepID=A0A7R7YH74_9VIRU|nr:RNA-dependent RNA polymerase ORF1 [Cereal yellow dwarf virus RPS]
MDMGLMKSNYLVFLWLTFFLFSSLANHTDGGELGLASQLATSHTSFNGGWLLATPPLYPPPRGECALNCAPCPAKKATEHSSHTLSHTAASIFSRFWKQTYEKSKEIACAAFGQLLWCLVYLWTGVLLRAASTICSVVTGYYLQVSALISLGITTSWIWKALKWTFGTMPASLCITLGKSICQVLTCRKYFNEKATKGFDSFSISQSPPKKSVITMRRSDKSHVGFAVCIRLFNNTNALVTCEHNLREAEAFYSPRTGRAIKLNEFSVIFKDADMDIAIVAGPENWESAFGCSGVHFTTHDRLAKCPAQIYVRDEEGWHAHFSKVVGHFDNFAQVWSNTKPGFSGAGYFNGKTLLGVHKGHAGNEFNFNLMAPIPPIEGITSPKYSIESDPPQGLVFPEEVAAEITRAVHTVYNDFFKHDSSIHSKTKQWKSGFAWADAEDESGNAKAAASAVPTAAPKAKANSSTRKGVESSKTVAPSLPKEQPSRGASQPTPTTSKTTHNSPDVIATSPDTTAHSGLSQPEIMQSLMSLLVEKIDVAKIERSIIDQVAGQALKKPRGKRGSNKKPAHGSSTSPASTPGKYQPPNKRSQASQGLANSPPSTTRERGAQQNGGGNSAPNTLSWVRKQQVSGGPQSVPPRN